MEPITIRIAQDFSRTPGGRKREDGRFSAEEFRKKLLVPALQKECKVIVVLDGVAGYGTSFLEETFGGLIREEHFDKNELDERLVIETDSDLLRSEVKSFIESAAMAPAA